jgi:hypothetical protein
MVKGSELVKMRNEESYVLFEVGPVNLALFRRNYLKSCTAYRHENSMPVI